MSILAPLGQETLVRQRPTVTINPKDGTHELGWPGTTVTFTNCMVEPPLIGNRLLVENTRARDYVDSLFKAYIPGDADITASDRVVWRGRTYNVKSEPQKRVDMDGNVDHIQLMIEYQAG